MPDRRKGTNAVPAREQRLEDSSRQFYSVSGFAAGIFRAYVSISYRLAKAYVAWETRSTKKFNTSSSPRRDRKSTRLNSSHLVISYAVFCLKKKKKRNYNII